MKSQIIQQEENRRARTSRQVRQIAETVGIFVGILLVGLAILYFVNHH